MGVREEVHEQILEILKGAKFPINMLEELISALPEGMDTTCMIGDVEVTAADAKSLITEKDFPFKDAKQLADLMVERAGL
ncbi:MAG: MTH865 family protein [Euryarchaeota archaeon]|nr:MTH865 family protein [Euryarchaeota archaeon]